jgi:hypothetical protein
MKTIEVLQNKNNKMITEYVRGITQYNKDHWDLFEVEVEDEYDDGNSIQHHIIDNDIELIPYWKHSEFNVKVTMPNSLILDDDDLYTLRDWVLQLKSEGRAEYYNKGEDRVMYFIELLEDHELLLRSFDTILIEYKEEL